MLKFRPILFLGLSLLLLGSSSVLAREWSFQVGTGFSHFEQQVKSEVGGKKGDILVNDSEFNLLVNATTRIWGNLGLGVFAQADWGHRSAGLYNGLDSENSATVNGSIGGAYSEYWLGPLVSYELKSVFFQLGYGAFGRRIDDSRKGIVNDKGSNSGSFSLSPTVAWLIVTGGRFDLDDNLELEIKVEYRIRYYDQRAGENLEFGITHGTQNLSPLIGLSLKI